jgi:hypothetical protein
MRERRCCIDQTLLHPFFDKGVIACQLRELSFPKEVRTTIS